MKRKALRVRSEGSIPPYVTEAESRKQHSDSPLCNSLPTKTFSPLLNNPLTRLSPYRDSLFLFAHPLETVAKVNSLLLLLLKVYVLPLVLLKLLLRYILHIELALLWLALRRALL